MTDKINETFKEKARKSDEDALEGMLTHDEPTMRMIGRLTATGITNLINDWANAELELGGAGPGNPSVTSIHIMQALMNFQRQVFFAMWSELLPKEVDPHLPGVYDMGRERILSKIARTREVIDETKAEFGYRRRGPASLEESRKEMAKQMAEMTGMSLEEAMEAILMAEKAFDSFVEGGPRS